jgi:CheY-like chemotaxis protein/GAF domain-containing protein
MATILVVDDNAINRKLLVAQLSSSGHMTLEAGDGFEGLQLARARHPQLIISDILMPSMDGYSFVRALRGEAQLAATPVIFCTAHYLEREALKLAQACGVDRVLLKPCNSADLLRAVEQVMAGLCESDPDPIPTNFDREHLRLVTNKLTESSARLAAVAARVEAVTQFNAGIAPLRDPKELLEKACSGARGIFGAAFAVLAVIDKASLGGVFHATNGIASGSIGDGAPSLGTGPLGLLLTSRTPWRITANEGENLDAGLPANYPPARAFLAAPLMTPKRVYGWLCLGDKLGAEGFDPEDEKLLVAFTALVGRAYENLSLHLALEWQTTKHRRVEERWRALTRGWADNLNRVYALLGATAALLARTHDRGSLCEDFCRLLVRIGQYRLAYVEMIDAAGLSCLVAAAGDSGALAQRLCSEQSRADDPLAAALACGRPMISNDLSNADFPLKLRNDLLDLGYRAIAAVPMGPGANVHAQMVVLADSPDKFDDAEVRLLGELSVMASAALAHRAVPAAAVKAAVR